MASKKFVYFFGNGKADGRGDMKDLLGGKGAGLAEMTNAGVPVPPGFTITTEVCALFYKAKNRIPKEVDAGDRHEPFQAGKSDGQEAGRRQRPAPAFQCAPAQSSRCRA